jgi:hypothetical protein
MNLFSKLAVSVLCFLPLAAQSYIMPTRTILQKTSENAGNGIYAVEQEVQFQNGNETLSLKESWLIENDHTMKLTVTGTKGLASPFRLQAVYAGGQKYFVSGNSRKTEKFPEDFLERYMNFRNPDVLATVLMHNDIIPNGSYNKKIVGKTSADFKYEPESWVRYSRTGGSVNYAFGTPTPVGQDKGNPGMWIEQDQFVVRKVRLPSQVEMTLDNYNQFAKGLMYPRVRTVRWGNNSVTIRLISVASRPNTAMSAMQPSTLEADRWDAIKSVPAKDLIEEFYTRFR